MRIDKDTPIEVRDGEVREDFNKLGRQLISLPLVMANLGHRTIKGAEMYHVGLGGSYGAYIAWLSNQNDETWGELIEAWGGKESFLKARRSLMESAFAGFKLNEDE